MAALHLTNLTKTYGSHTILEFAEWKISTGIYWIKGGNGTGKTTLFKTIAGQTPFKGETAIDQIYLRQQPVAYRAMISYAEAEPQYPPFLTGQELLDYYIAVRKADHKIADKLVGQFKMEDFMGNKISSYSSGMLKKLSLIAAFIGEVQLYILDEPLITIDTASAEVLYNLIKTFHQQGKTFLISSHQEIDQHKIPLNGIFEIRNHQLAVC
ncbi:ABC transporter ATP-binding protein [Pedobacter sp. L105]|uniref:ABC transporter ATP-binding protein n=1 Tax=Pedobacter sp. L105 TaxID=1641871 RepID=UPI00131D6259|nr:ABC transporter ATP-binding protein [Pedobacter sp. L105]